MSTWGPRGMQGPPGVGVQGPSGPPGATGLSGPPGPSGGGVVYTRWGRTTCPDTPGTELLYAGRAAGTHYNYQGGGANYLCLPHIPEYLDYQSGDYSHSYLYGTEYHMAGSNGPLSSDFFNHNAPCAVCYATRAAVLALPAIISCPATWTREYYGYLITSFRNHHRTTFECLDKDPESIPGSAGNADGVLFHMVEATCTGIPCPPYDTQKELTCVVCTK